MTTRLLDFAPAAWEAYQRLRSSRADDLDKRLKRALERLTEDPGATRADPGSARYHILEKRLRGPAALRPPVWGLPIDAPDGTTWLVIWREMPHVIEVGYIGPVPGQAASAPACTSQDEQER